MGYTAYQAAGNYASASESFGSPILMLMSVLYLDMRSCEGAVSLDLRPPEAECVLPGAFLLLDQLVAALQSSVLSSLLSQGQPSHPCMG